MMTMKTTMMLSCLVTVAMVKIAVALERRVLEEILSGGSAHSTPPFPVNVSFSLDFTCFLFDPETRMLQTVVEERYLWTDPRVAWENDANKIQLLRSASVITASSSLLWTPDIKLYNRIKLSEKDAQVMARIFYNGSIAWFLLAIHYTLCSREERELLLQDRILYLATCRLKFGPWTHLKDEVILSAMDEAFHDLKHYDGNCARVNSMTSGVVETYSSSMIYYDFDIVVREVPREPEVPPPPPPPPVDPAPELEPEITATEALTSAAGSASRSWSWTAAAASSCLSVSALWLNSRSGR